MSERRVRWLGWLRRFFVPRALVPAFVVLVTTVFALGCPQPQTAQKVRSDVTAFAALADQLVDLEVATCARWIARADRPGAPLAEINQALKVGHACQEARDRTRRGLLLILDTLPTYSDAKAGLIGCGARDVLQGLQDFGALFPEVGEALPTKVEDGIDQAIRYAAISLPVCVPLPAASTSSSGLAPNPWNEAGPQDSVASDAKEGGTP